ncbi:MAG: hypothetical protein RL095_786 [Verrucomicrobiota bacterium]
MRPEDLIIVARPRREEETVALGLALARRHYAGLFGIWLGSFGLLALLLAPLLLVESTGLLYGLLLWWLAPVCERFLIFWLSRKAFAVELKKRDLWRQARDILLPGLLVQLTILRLSPARGVHIPLWILENCPWSDLRARTASLQRGTADLFHLLFWKIEILVSFGVLAILLLLLPTGPAGIFDLIHELMANGEISPGMSLMLLLSWPLAVLLLRPFYVAVSFAIYLNGRMLDEAWDLRLGFRALAERLQRFAVRSGLILLGMACFVFTAPSSARAESSQAQEMKQILADPQVFGVAPPVKPEKSSGCSGGGSETLSGVFTALAILLVAALVGLLIWFLISSFLNRGKSPALVLSQEEKASFSGRLLPGEEVLADHFAAAQAAFAAGDLRACLSWLYQGNIAYLVKVHEVSIPDSATEGDCLRLARPRLDSGPMAYFDELSRVWIRVAYAHEVPPLEEVQEQLEGFRRVWRLSKGGL